MRYSANLNIIVKAIEKASAFASRDYIELENLQSNPTSANRFANSCYNKIKQTLADDFSKFRPNYNMIFSDGEKIIRNKDAEYSYIIFPIEGMPNLGRAHPDFTIAVALVHKNELGHRESISVAISKIYGGELYYCEKGFGSYLNNRRIRVSKRIPNNDLVVSSEDQAAITAKLAGKNFSMRSHGCRSLELAYVAAARLEMALFSKKDLELFKPLLLIVKEAGGKIIEEEKAIIACA